MQFVVGAIVTVVLRSCFTNTGAARDLWKVTMFSQKDGGAAAGSRHSMEKTPGKPRMYNFVAETAKLKSRFKNPKWNSQRNRC